MTNFLLVLLFVITYCTSSKRQLLKWKL